jgi:energy-converting hydrogenase Eha subunit G
MAGVIGGAIAGPLGLLAVYYYTGFRDSVWNLELVLIQGIAGLPGIGVGLLIKRFSSFLDPSNAGFEESAAGRPE